MMSRPAVATILAVMLICACAAHADAYAQQPAMHTLLPDTTIQRVVGLYNRTGTTRLTGESRLAAGTTLTGDVATLNGTLELGGHVTGDVVVINGDVHVLATAVVDGSVTAVGGLVRLEPGAVVTKEVVSYRELLRFRVDGDELTYLPPAVEGGLSAGRDFRFGRTDLLLAVRGSYNRVEGLPIAFGPRITIGSDNPTRVQALVIYRTTTGVKLDVDDFGYFLGTEHYLHRRVRMNIDAYREIVPIEEWSLSEREAGIAAFVLRRDYRDHYERRGWTAGLRLQQPGSPLTVGLQYRGESNRSVAPRDAWSVFNSGEEWRPEPLVAEGRLHSLKATGEYDTRNDARDPADGWLIRAFLEQGLGGSLATHSASLLPAQAPGIAEFTMGRIDVRRYGRLTPYSRVAMRVLVSGSLDGDPLPPQRQHTLGGEGSLPAYPLLAFDCDARSNAVPRGEDYFPFHGCDRLAMMQLEFQSGFPFARKIGEKLRLGSWLTNSVRWSTFLDVGRTWNEPEAQRGRGPGRDDFSADAGVGLKFGPVGTYLAFPLSGSDHKYNFFMRLGPRL